MSSAELLFLKKESFSINQNFAIIFLITEKFSNKTF